MYNTAPRRRLDMTSAGKRIIGITIATAIVCVVIGLYIGLYLVNVPGSVAATQTSSGAQLYLATVPTAEASDAHPTWVSYYAVDANSQNWQHKTTYVLPANTVVHVTIYNFDSASGLRNPWFGQSTGTVGGVITLDGKTTPGIDPDNASHVFSIPQLGLSVPLNGVSSTAKNTCSQAPCSLTNAHTTTSFTFRTPGPGLYRWQCFVPCAAGYIAGFGGPMQTVGYMDGFIKVV
jgi:hypothetical protein